MEPSSSDPFASSEAEIEVDAETAAAIERGIWAAGNGQVVTAEVAREKLLSK